MYSVGVPGPDGVVHHAADGHVVVCDRVDAQHFLRLRAYDHSAGCAIEGFDFCSHPVDIVHVLGHVPGEANAQAFV